MKNEEIYWDQVYLKAPGGLGWRVMPTIEWMHEPSEGDESRAWRHFVAAHVRVPRNHEWLDLWDASEKMVPWATVVVGGELQGDDPRLSDAAGERLPGLLLVNLIGSFPDLLSRLRHEIMHEVWPHLATEETAALEDYGKFLRELNKELGGVYQVEWFDRKQEAEAKAFEVWAMGARDFLNQPIAPAAITVFRNIISGGIRDNDFDF